MLVLRRHVNEEIFVGDVRIVLIDITGDTAGIGIDAPPEIKIRRAELVTAPKPKKIADFREKPACGEPQQPISPAQEEV